MRTGFLIPVEVEAQHIALVNVIIVKILRKLLLTTGIVLLPVPYLHFDDELFSQIVNNQISPTLISCSGFNIIIRSTVDDRAQE